MKNKLTAVAIKKSAPGKLFDGGGLTLVKKVDSGQWVYRYSHLGKRREMGLGAWPVVSLAAARESRDQWAGVLASGKDPISVRKAGQASEVAERDKADPTFSDAVDLVFEARKATLRDGGKRGRWRSPLDQHVSPYIGKKRMSEIHQTDIRDALAKIWQAKHPTAQKAIQRTRIVFERLKLMGYDCDAFTVDAAREMLGAVNHQTTPTPSTNWREIPALFAKLDSGSSVDQALRFLMLTCVRASAAIGARFDEIDGSTWTVPADRIKGREGKVTDFRVPLSDMAALIANEQRQFFTTHLFCSHTGRPITTNGLEQRLNALGEAGRPHGFRASFRTWASDNDACGWEVSETILGHTVGSKVERAYDRSDLLDRRRLVMEAWSAHVTGQSSARVVAI